jgi:hypothetical protein
MIVAGPGLGLLPMVDRDSNDIDPARLNCDTKSNRRSFDSLRFPPQRAKTAQMGHIFRFGNRFVPDQ